MNYLALSVKSISNCAASLLAEFDKDNQLAKSSL